MEILNGIPPAQQLAPGEAAVRWTSVEGRAEYIPNEDMFIRVGMERRRVTKIHVELEEFGYAAGIQHIGLGKNPTTDWWDSDWTYFDLNWEAHPNGLVGRRSGKYLSAGIKGNCWKLVKKLRRDLLHKIDKHDSDALL